MMKKLILLAATLLVATMAQAQLSLGLKAGLNLASLPSDFETATAVGFHAGLWSKVGAGPVGLRTELLFSTKGSETTISSEDLGGIAEVTSDIDLMYIDVPIMAEFSPLPILKLHLGPQFSFLVNDKVKTEVKSGSLPGTVEAFEDSYDFKSLDLGLVAGAGVTVAKFDAGLRYNLGLSKVSEFSVAGLKNTDFKNSVFQVYVGFKFK